MAVSKVIGNDMEISSLIENIYFKSNNVSSTITCVAHKGEFKDININKDVCFYRIKRLSFDEDYPHREAFENVLLALDTNAYNFVYILSGTEEGIELYLGVVKNDNDERIDEKKTLRARDYGAVLAGLFEGNFGGSILEKLTETSLKEKIFSAAENYKNAGIIMGIPSENQNQKDSGKGFQGMDRLINSMLGLNWRLVIVAEPSQQEDILSWRREVYYIYNLLAPYAKGSIQQSVSNGSTHTDGTNSSEAKGLNYSKGSGENSGKSHQSGNDSSSSGYSTSEQHGESTNITNGKSKSDATNQSKTNSLSAEFVNKEAQELLKYVDEELLERIKQGLGRGFFKTAIYYMADKPSTANRLKVGIMSLFQGEASSYSPLTAYSLDLKKGIHTKDTLRLFQNISTAQDIGVTSNQRTLLSYHNQIGSNSLSTWLTATEVSLLAGLPQKEIPGISVIEGVDFGLNVALDDAKKDDGDVEIGPLVQKGRKLEHSPLKLPRDFINKHTFIAGVTGSGKTTTCHKLLKEAGVPFLVIEPAKTEYRALLDSKEFGDCVVFTVGDEDIAPFRFNPFELVKGENISSHIDMLKATFTSAFPMEGSMPQLLEEAIYKCYEDKGWNVDTNRNEICTEYEDYEDGAEFTGKYDVFPILSDFLNALQVVVEEKNFDSRLKNDYIGTLVSRFSNLRKGAKGRMLNTEHSVDFFQLAEKKVIIELENLKSAEDKALVMGLILFRLSAVIRQKHRENKEYRHITLVEEAHRLLSKVEYGDSGSKKSAVETFTDLLAEVRKYGEGLIIVDQIPNKLAPEVIKNTNTKIIHKLLARDDKETVGDAMLMDDKQKAFLSALPTGEAVIFTEKLTKPVHVAIKAVTDTSSSEISDEKIRKKYLAYMKKTHRKVLLNKAIVDELYTMYNRVLKDYVQSPDSVKTNNFSKAIKSFCQKTQHKEEQISYDDIWVELAKEKTKRMMTNDQFFETLVRFSKFDIGGTAVEKPLTDMEHENLKKILKEIGMNN